MKNHTFKFLIVVLMSSLCSICVASTQTNSLDRVLRLSGLTKQVGEFPGLVKAGFIQGIQQGAPLPENEVELILDSADRAIVPSTILDEIRGSLKYSLSEREIQTLLKWYESEIGKRITAAEEEASTPEAYELMINSAQEMLEDSERVEVAARLDELLGATDMTMDIQKMSGLAVYSAIMTAMAPEQELNPEAFQSQMAEMEPQMRENVRQLVLVSFIYSYQQIDDDSLAEYEAFLNLPVSQKFNSAVVTGLNRGFTQAVSRWASDIALIMKNPVR